METRTIEWLSKKENIENLNDILGLTLVDISKETYVGSYRYYISK